MKLELNYRTVYFFFISISAIILILMLTDNITKLNFKSTVIATILIILSGVATWIYDIYLEHCADEEEASQYWHVWFYPPFKELKDKQRIALIVFVVFVSIVTLFSWLGSMI